MTKIILIDSKNPFREAIRNLLMTQVDFNLVGIGKDGYDAIRLTNETKADVVILDMDIPLLNGLKTAACLHARYPNMGIIIIAENIEDRTLVDAVCGGVTGFLLRDKVFDEITSAVKSVTSGNCFISNALTMRTFNMFTHMVKSINSNGYGYSMGYDTTKSRPHINRTELRITTFIGQGLSTRQISEILKLKEGTVRNYISLILQKTKLKHRTQIALYALKNGLHSEDVFKQDAPVNGLPRNNAMPMGSLKAFWR
jgi:DNA-binding NarL/FixJ family response regulator